VVLNFIAGLILSFEKPIHVGDVIEVDQDMGRVTEVGVRASKVLSWNGSEVIVPNGILISKKIIEILINVASQHTNTLEKPAPMALFNGYESHALDFTIYCWVSFKDSLSTKSEIAIGIFKAMAAAGIESPIPIQKISIDNSES
jgi:potassium efflux system protein